MATYDLTKKTHASTGQTLMLSEKLDQIAKLLNELSEKKSAS